MDQRGVMELIDLSFTRMRFLGDGVDGANLLVFAEHPAGCTLTETVVSVRGRGRGWGWGAALRFHICLY